VTVFPETFSVFFGGQTARVQSALIPGDKKSSVEWV